MMNKFNYTDVVRKTLAFKGLEKDYWAGVEIVKEHGGLTETEMVILDGGLTTKSGAIVTENLAKLKKEAQEISDSLKTEKKTEEVKKETVKKK